MANYLGISVSNPRNKWLAGSAGAMALIVGGLTTWEGNKAKTYDDIAGIATVCIGHTGIGVERGRTYTKDECEAFLRDDLAEHTTAVLRCVTVPIGKRRYAAFVLFSYNVGASAFCNSSLLRKLNAGDVAGACDGLMAWNKSTIDGKLTEVRGLTRRREYERTLCLSGL